MQELGIIGILLLTSKGAAGVTGSGFIVLAATLASVGTIPVASIALILGIDRFMSEARALTNLIGNGLATVVVAKWEGALDEKRLHRRLDRETELEADEPEAVKVEDDVLGAGATAADPGVIRIAGRARPAPAVPAESSSSAVIPGPRSGARNP